MLSSSKNRKILNRLGNCANYKIIFEAVGSSNCSLKIRKGDKFVFSATGLYLPDESTANPCLQAIANFVSVLYIVCERVLEGLDPDALLGVQYVQCQDIGVENGGWGKTVYKVKCIRDPHDKAALLDRKFTANMRRRSS
jgi:uncharacterized repeat protein (TIGR04076 family)